MPHAANAYTQRCSVFTATTTVPNPKAPLSLSLTLTLTLTFVTCFGTTTRLGWRTRGVPYEHDDGHGYDHEPQDEGAAAVAEALSGTAPNVRELEFSYNELTAEGAEAVAACAARKASTLEYLGLEGNEIGSAGAKSVRAVFHVELDFAARQRLVLVFVCVTLAQP